MDRRAAEVSELLLRRIGRDELYRTCGWPVMDGLGLPLLTWFRRRRPDLMEKARYVCSTVDYLNRLLTGRRAVDHTNLALTGFLDLATGGLSEKTMDVAGLSSEHLPEIVPSGEVVGTLTPDAAKRLGLSGRVAVVSGAHDRYCESIGAGAVEPGECVLGAGTSWVLLAVSRRLLFLRSEPGELGMARSVFPGMHPVRGRYGLMTVVPYEGGALGWYRDALRDGREFEQLNQNASRVSPGSDGLLFVPISGSSSGKGAFVRIDGVHGSGHFSRAVMEGVAFLNRVHLELFAKAGLTVDRLVMIGGGTRCGLWPQMVADVCGVPVELPDMREAACAGAGMLAAYGCGMLSSIEEGGMRSRGKSRRLEPDGIRMKRYEECYEDFTEYLDVV
jgi:xylulokinase